MRARKGQGGFTLVEVIVVAGIIAILAGILVPLILKEIDESRITRAHGDIRSISSALIVFKKDIGKWPKLSETCTANVTLLASDGTIPSNADGMTFTTTKTMSINSYLPADGTDCYGVKWKGPYLPHAGADPWGNSYLINAENFDTPQPVWLISAGPDGLLNTGGWDQSLGGDDVGLRVK